MRGTGRPRALAHVGQPPTNSESGTEHMECGRHETEEAYKVSGEDSEERTNPRGAVGSLSGS